MKRLWIVAGLVIALIAAVPAGAANPGKKNAGKKNVPAKVKGKDNEPKAPVKPTELIGTIAVKKDASGFPSATLTTAEGTVYIIKNPSMVAEKDGQRIKAICNAKPTTDSKTKKHHAFIDQVTAAPSL